MKGIEKVKTYVKEHKKEIALIAGTTVVGVCLGWKMCAKANGIDKPRFIITEDSMIHLLDDAQKEINKGVQIFTGISDTPILPEDLGKLNEAMSHCVPKGQGFTHFIALGKSIEMGS